ncbi:MAG: EAL domain-containing protein [Pseudomonadota bacterium]
MLDSCGLRILYIEDDPADVLLLRRSLESNIGNDFHVDSIGNLNDAHHALQRRSYHAVLLDLSLPDSNNLKSIESLTNSSSEAAIIVLTGTNCTDNALMALRHGAQDYLVKGSFNSDTICRTIRHAIERKQSELALWNVAHTDSLTGLPNRMHINNHLEHAIHRSERSGNTLSVFLIDFDHFKKINDTLGHAAGDQFIAVIAKRLKEVLRGSDFVGRLGGDEFMAIVEHYKADAPEVVAENLLEAVSKPCAVIGKEGLTSSTCSIGITVYTPGKRGIDLEELYFRADTAMYRAKNRGGNCYQFFDTKIARSSAQRAKRIKELDNALQSSQYLLKYRPIVSSNDHKLAGMEALLFWQQSDGLCLHADEFLPLLEQSHKTVAVWKWAIEQCCSDFDRIKDASTLPIDGFIGINVPASLMREIGFSYWLKQLLVRFALPEGSLQLQLTEPIPAHDPKVTDTLHRLRKLGVCMAIDNFGSACSTIQTLKNVTFDVLKLDPSFVQDRFNNPADVLIARAIINLGKDLNKTVVVDGVATMEIADMLHRAGCDYLQGDLFGEPLIIQGQLAKALQGTNGNE